jgi:hypothetical protein
VFILSEIYVQRNDVIEKNKVGCLSEQDPFVSEKFSSGFDEVEILAQRRSDYQIRYLG